MPPAPLRPFIGRAEERARLLSLWAEAEAGRPGFALVSGDAGVGKTHLLESVIRAVGEAGGQVLTGACIQVGDYGVPYLPIVDALRAVESDPAGAQLLRAEAARRPALGRLIPHLTSQPVPADDLGEGLVQGQLFEAVHRVLSELAETRPVLLVVEDLHWADRSTRHLLSFLARTMRAGRVVVLASYRTDDLHRRHPLRPLLAELTRLPHVVRVPLHSFTLSETAELLDVLAGTAVDPAVIEAVHRRSEGNAFFAEELWRAYAAGGTGVGLPSDLADLLLTKVEGLPQAGRDVLALAAVAWRDIPYELLVRVAEPDGIDVDEGLRQAIEAGVLIGDGERYSFRHALLREAVHGDLLPGQRVRLHARFADVLAGPLEGLGLTGRVSPAELAHYRLVSHDQQGALQALLSAAAEAEAMAAPAEALVHLEQAVELVERLDAPVDRIDLLTRAAEAAAAIGDAVRARRLGQQVVQEADRSGQVLVRR